MFGYGHWGYGMGWFGPVLGMITMIVVWGGLITLVVVFARHHSRHSASPNARTVLDERFARGEIDAEEYRSRRAALGS